MSIPAFLCFDGRYPVGNQMEHEVQPEFVSRPDNQTRAMKASLKSPSHPAGNPGVARICYREEKISLTVVIVPARRGTIDIPLTKEKSSPDSPNDSIRTRCVDIYPCLSSAGE